MIGTAQKPFEEILAALAGHQKIAVVGCDGCAKVCLTGGSEQVKEFAGQLKEEGKQVVLEVTPERTCYVDKSHTKLDPYVEQLKEAEAVIVLGCGGAVQITRQVTEELGLTIPVKTALDSVGHMDTLVSGELAMEQCQECGECILNETGGICQVFLQKFFLCSRSHTFYIILFSDLFIFVYKFSPLIQYLFHLISSITNL